MMAFFLVRAKVSSIEREEVEEVKINSSRMMLKLISKEKIIWDTQRWHLLVDGKGEKISYGDPCFHLGSRIAIRAP
jgi:hypothetical protein